MKHSMTLGARLALALTLLALLTALVGGFGLNRLAAVNAGADDIAGHWLPKAKVLGDLRSLSNRMRRTEAEHLLALDAASIAAAEQRLADDHREHAATQAEYALLIRSDEERSLYAAAREREDHYFAVQQRLLELSRAGGAASREARVLFSGESKAAFNAMVTSLAQLVDLNARGWKAADEAAHQVYRSASVVMLILVLGAVLASVCLAALLLRSVRRTLGADPAVAAQWVEQVARGDLDVKIRLAPGDTSSLMASLQSMQDRLGAIVQEARANAQSVVTASTRIAYGNVDLSSRTGQQASALQQTAASMEVLGATVRQNAGHARQATHVAQAACSVAAEGGIVVEAVVETMKDIEEASRRVGSIVAVIDAIAIQTNLLALNAAVEAARAGAQGSGFAVVASEVRSLARRSAEAAQEIKTLITVSTDRVARGAEQASLAGAKMASVVGSIAGVSELMEQISRASQEQHQGVDQIGAAVSRMDHATQQNAALVEQSAAAAASLSTQAAALVETMSVFRVRAPDEPATLPPP